jgi:putative tricarboxylic transport membrane protein
MDLRATISFLFWLVVGVAVALGSVRLGVGQVNNPGAGFLSFYAGLLLIILSLILAVLEIRKRRRMFKFSSSFSLPISKNLAIALGSLFGFALILEMLGYLISTGLFVFVLFKITAPRKWVGPLFWAIGISLVTYFLFSVLLECNFPKGVFNLG